MIGGYLQNFEMFGVILQWVALYYCAMVIWQFKGFKAIHGNQWTNPANVISLAIFYHFIFSMIDGAYWQIAWISDYSGSDLKGGLFSHGIISNVFFRHLGIIFIAYLHLSAISMQSGKTLKRLNIGGGIVLMLAIMHTWYIAPNG